MSDRKKYCINLDFYNGLVKFGNIEVTIKDAIENNYFCENCIYEDLKPVSVRWLFDGRKFLKFIPEKEFDGKIKTIDSNNYVIIFYDCNDNGTELIRKYIYCDDILLCHTMREREDGKNPLWSLSVNKAVIRHFYIKERYEDYKKIISLYNEEVTKQQDTRCQIQEA